MDCEQAKKELQELLDGEISISRRDELLLHCGKCGSCRADQRALGLLAAELKRTPTPQPGNALKTAVLSKIAMDAGKPARVSHLLAAAALLLTPELVSFVFGLFTKGRLTSIISFREEEISTLISSVPILDNFRLSLSVTYFPHTHLTVFLTAVMLLILVCQINPHDHVKRRHL